MLYSIITYAFCVLMTVKCSFKSVLNVLGDHINEICNMNRRDVRMSGSFCSISFLLNIVWRSHPNSNIAFAIWCAQFKYLKRKIWVGFDLALHDEEQQVGPCEIIFNHKFITIRQTRYFHFISNNIGSPSVILLSQVSMHLYLINSFTILYWMLDTLIIRICPKSFCLISTWFSWEEAHYQMKIRVQLCSYIA